MKLFMTSKNKLKTDVNKKEKLIEKINILGSWLF